MNNFTPIQKKLTLPAQKNDVSIFLLSDSFEYDIELIKNMPPPRIDYKNIIIPSQVNNKIGVVPVKYNISQNEYARRINYVNSQRVVPKLNIVRFPYPATISDNIYISISDLVKTLSNPLRTMSTEYIENNICMLFDRFMKLFNFSKTKILVIDVDRFKLYKNPNRDTYKADIINAFITSCILNPSNSIKNLGYTIIFRSTNCDYKFDMKTFSERDIVGLKDMISKIGKSMMPTSDSSNVGDSADDIGEYNGVEDSDIESVDSVDPEEDDKKEVKDYQSENRSASESLKSQINALKTQYGTSDSTEQDQEQPKNSLYSAKTLGINATLLKRIATPNDVIDDYKKISNDNTQQNGSVEDRLLADASKKMSDIASSNDQATAPNAATSARELEIRKRVGQVKLNNVSFDTLTSTTDTPLPTPLKPLRLTTTNLGALKGTGFAHVAKEYEDKLLDRDIVATFMNLSKLPDGFYVTDVQVTDISTVTSLMNNWKVSLKNKKSDKLSVINIRIPKVINGRFYNNGIWYNIGKQDFPIPVLKINKKTVMLTTNYNKITVERYDTKSLVDINMMTKTLTSVTDEKGLNKYIKPGSSVNTNSRFISTIEYDEYAKRWYHFINKEAGCEIYFNRQQCLKLYTFVSVSENEFCCGMINKVPIVINTDTGLTRDGKTLTDTILSTLPADLQEAYSKIKPGKLSMYSQITVGVVLPLGVAIAAWEGMSSLLKRSGCKYQYVDKSFYDNKFIVIPFKDKAIAIENSTQNQLLFNGFYRINTKGYNLSEFEIPIMNSNSIYVDIFNQLFFTKFSQITNFITCYNFFVDAITQDVCLHYNIPNDIAGMLIYASNLLADNSHSSENHSSLYRIRSTEIIPAIIHYRLALAISRYNGSVGSKSKGSTITFNPNEVLNELLEVPNVEPMSALNPMVELHARENITKKGFSGVNSERTYSLDKRTYDDSMIGKMALSSPNNGNVGINRQLVADPKIESVRGYTSMNGVEADYNDLQLASFSELLTPGTVTRDDAIRTAIATSQTSHIVSTAGSQPVLISNGVDEIVPSYLTEEFAFTAEDDGKVLDIEDGYMIVQYKSGKKKAINVGNKYSFNTGSGFYVDNQLQTNFEVGDEFKKNDILAYHAKFFSKDSSGIVRLNIGPLAKVAFAGLYSTYEDAGLITTKMSKKLETKITMMQSTKINATDNIEKIVQVGDEIEIDDPLIVFGLGDTGDKSVDNFLKAFQTDSDTSVIDSAKRIIRSKHAGRVVDVRMYTIKSMDKLSPSLFEIFDNYFKSNIKKRRILDKHDKTNSVYKLDTLYTLPTEPLKGSSIKGITCDVLIEIYIEHADEASVGDKLVVYGASKQVLSEVVPEGLEPYAESSPDEEISVFVAPSAILKRMIPSLTITASGNKVLIELKRQIKKIWENE